MLELFSNFIDANYGDVAVYSGFLVYGLANLAWFSSMTFYGKDFFKDRHGKFQEEEVLPAILGFPALTSLIAILAALTWPIWGVVLMVAGPGALLGVAARIGYDKHLKWEKAKQLRLEQKEQEQAELEQIMRDLDVESAGPRGTPVTLRAPKEGDYLCDLIVQEEENVTLSTENEDKVTEVAS